MSAPEYAAAVLAPRPAGARAPGVAGAGARVVEVDLELVTETTFEVDRHERRVAVEVEHRPGMALQSGQALIEPPARSGQAVLVEARDATNRRTCGEAEDIDGHDARDRRRGVFSVALLVWAL